MKIPALLFTAVLLAFFSAQPLPGAEQKTAKIDIVDTAAKKVGVAELRDTPQGVLIQVTVSHIPPGIHAIHIHEVGKCEPPFNSAGGHFNPLSKQHGLLAATGMHAGDLPNIHVPESGSLAIELLAPQLTLSGGKASLMDSDGSALIIHRGSDDYHTDPTGGAGDRIACGVIAPSKTK